MTSLMTKLEGRSGFTITELLLSVIIIAVGVVGFATAVGLIATELRIGKRDTEVALLMADQAEQIKAQPYDSVSSGSRVVGEYALDWLVQGANPKTVILEATFPGYGGSQLADTIVFYIEK